MRAVDIIIKKRDGLELSSAEIDFFVQGFARGEIPDYQAAAWAMEALPQWRRLIELAIKSYQGQATPEEQAFMQAEAPWMYSFACERIEAAGRR